MYHKISSIILNTGRASGFGDIFISQPDVAKESLAGKFFVIAEVEGKKTEARKIFEFLIGSLEETYYEDEKIFLRDKIEGLKIENIFEAAVSKTNKNLLDFLKFEKIKINPQATNLTIGVIFENKLYFSNYGRNRAFLLYRQKDQYELINVEASATDQPEQSGKNKLPTNQTNLFSSVISGEIPQQAYFLFTSEALPEYLTERQLSEIISKLPPVVAAEQIKNTLSSINSFIPFLGIIIKNTVGQEKYELAEPDDQGLGAHSSISGLNNLEEKTERLLAPAGLVSFSKLRQRLLGLKKQISLPQRPSKRYAYPDSEKSDTESASPVVTDLKQVAKKKRDSLIASSNISLTERASLAKFAPIKLLKRLLNSFNFHYLKSFLAKFKQRLRVLSGRRKLLISLIAVALIVLITSISFSSLAQKRKAAENHYQNLLTTITEKQEKIEQDLLYENETAAKQDLADAWELVSYLPQAKKEQLVLYERLVAALQEKENLIYKITTVTDFEPVNDLIGLEVKSLVAAGQQLYAAAQGKVYEITPNSAQSEIFNLPELDNLRATKFDSKSLIYYLTGNQIIKFDLKSLTGTPLTLSEEIANNSQAYDFFSTNLYTLAIPENQIYKSLGSTSYQQREPWLTEELDLSEVSDMAIDGNIYLLKKNGQLLKLRLGKLETYQAGAVEPALSQASKLILGELRSYVFDFEAKRLIVRSLDTGSLVAQYQLDFPESIQDLSVSESQGQAYLLSDETVWSFAIK